MTNVTKDEMVNGVLVSTCPASGVRYSGACPYCHLMSVAQGALREAMRAAREYGDASAPAKAWDKQRFMEELGEFDPASPFEVEQDEETGVCKLVEA